MLKILQRVYQMNIDAIDDYINRNIITNYRGNAVIIFDEIFEYQFKIIPIVQGFGKQDIIHLLQFDNVKERG